jgi:glycosyltransferase involved in cell wall biosynthesis
MATVPYSSQVRRTAPSRATLPARSFTPRRVLQIITPSHMSGAETQVLRVTHRMRERGHTMPVLVKHGSSAVAEMQRRGFEVETARIGGKANVLAVPTIARAARRHGVDLVQSNLSTASWWCGWLEAFGGPKSVGHVHGFTSARWHRRQSHLLAVSGAVRDDLIAHGIPGDRITVLWNALDADEFRPSRDPLAVRAEFGADAHTPVIGTFGHLSVKKGQRELFAAIPTVLRTFPTAQFWIVGQGPLRDELEATARAGGFLDNVRLAGYRRDAADVMNALDVFCLPSHREPCALVYVEAALLAKPIVACRAGGAPESIADGETGLLVPPRQAEGIAEALLTLLENRDAARRMGQAGHDRARQLFNWPNYVATLESVYDRVLS